MAHRILPRSLCHLVLLAAAAAATAKAQDTSTPSSLALSETLDSSTATEQQSPDPGPYFYRDLAYGSDASFGPFAVILNKGFALSATEGKSRRIADFPYGVGGVADALAHPGAAIERSGGWWQFVRQEMLPLSYKNQDQKWYTNYTGHVIEGGIYWRKLKEWYEARDVPLPGLMSGLTTMSAAFLNEIYELDGAKSGNSGTVADLYFFDLAGILLFSFDGVSRFFANTLHADVWTGQASIVFPSGEVDNNFSHLHFKFPFPWGLVPKSSIFFWTGIGGGLGLTLHRGNGLDISFGAGIDAQRMNVDPVTGEETAKLALGAGLFVDQNGSLLASAHVSEVAHRLLRVNLYPGLVGGPGRNLGVWMALDHDFRPRVGISSRYWLGAGLGVGR
jgi:hypothetical protein